MFWGLHSQVVLPSPALPGSALPWMLALMAVSPGAIKLGLVPSPEAFPC